MPVLTPRSRRLSAAQNITIYLIKDFPFDIFPGIRYFSFRLHIQKCTVNVTSNRHYQPQQGHHMQEPSETYKKLLDENALLKQRIRELERLEAADRRTEELLKESEERYRKLIETTRDLVYTTDGKGFLTYINPTLEKTLGYTSDEWKGKAFTQLVDPGCFGLVKELFKRAMGGESIPVYEVYLLSKDGKRFPVEFNVVTICDSKGKPAGRYGVGRDVTDRKRAEDALRESEQQLNRIINGSPIPTFVIGKDHRVLYWNKALEEMSRIRFEDIAGTGEHWRAFYGKERPCIADVLVDENFERMDDWYAGKYIRSRLIDEAYEATDFFPDLGSEGKWLRFTAAVIRDSQGGVIGAVETLEDITEQKYAEELYRSMANNAQIGVYIVQEGRIVFNNAHIPRYSGYTNEELSGSRIIEYVHPEDRGRVRQSALSMLKGESSEPYEYRIIDREGNVKWLMEVVAAIHFGGKPAVLGSTMDITRRIHMEEEEDKLKTQLIQAQKMEAIGALAGGIAHDFNNILAGIMGYTELYKELVVDRPQVYESMREVLKATKRAKDLVQQILTFSRQTSHEKRPTILVPVVKEVAKFLRASLPTTIEIKTKMNVTSDLIMADPTQIHQVLMNLCTNAGQAMKETGGTLEIGLRDVIIDSDDWSRFPSLDSGSYLELSVRDTGCGIAPENMEKIFEPYFTTKVKGEGTGLGLAVVHGIVKDHGGEIKVYSEVGKGSSFQVLLPLIERREEETEDREELILRGNGERILFIDDEQVLVDLGRELLESLGYKVVAESDPAVALVKFKENRDAFDLVITDKTMPYMTGFDVAKELRQLRADIPVILCSGYQDKSDVEKLSAMNIGSFLTKPVSKKDLADAIRSVLAKKTVSRY